MLFEFEKTVTYFLILFLVSLIIFHLLFVWPKNKSIKWWKVADYVWLFAIFLSIISISADLRQNYAKNKVDKVKIYAESNLQYFIKSYIKPPPSYICRVFIRSDYSPNNFDEIQEEYNQVCEWLSQLGSAIEITKTSELELINWEKLDAPVIKDDLLKKFLEEMQNLLHDYNIRAQNFIDANNALHSTKYEEFFYALWPYLFVLSIAFRISKTSGELLHLK